MRHIDDYGGGIIDSLFWRIAVKDDEIAFRSLFDQFFSPLCVFAHRYVEC